MLCADESCHNRALVTATEAEKRILSFASWEFRMVRYEERRRRSTRFISQLQLGTVRSMDIKCGVWGWKTSHLSKLTSYKACISDTKSTGCHNAIIREKETAHPYAQAFIISSDTLWWSLASLTWRSWPTTLQYRSTCTNVSKLAKSYLPRRLRRIKPVGVWIIFLARYVILSLHFPIVLLRCPCD